MAFSTLFFAFVFLPISLALYYIVPRVCKNSILVILSLVFFSWGTPSYMILMLFSVLFNYLAGLWMDTLEENPGMRRIAVILSVTANIVLLGFFKYWGFLLRNLNVLLGTGFTDSGLAAPLGVSFYTFQILSYLFDVYRHKTPVQKNLLDFACYVTFFPKLVSGPIVEYNKFYPQLHGREKVDLIKFGDGARLFFVGLGKKLIIADGLSAAYSAVTGLDDVTVGLAWLGCIYYTLNIYFDFSSYSDMAIGIAKMFGFEIDKNFDYPYMSENVSEFWRRWHISLGTWFRNYVYIPLGGNRCSKAKHIRNIMTVWILTGIWHGSEWTFVAWGLFYGILLLLEKYIYGALLAKLPKFIRHIYTMLMVMIGWVFFFSPSIGSAFSWLGKMFFIGADGLWSSTTTYYFSGNIILMVIAIIGCIPTIPKLSRKITELGGLGSLMINASYILIVLGSIAYMVNSTYSSFLYFAF